MVRPARPREGGGARDAYRRRHQLRDGASHSRDLGRRRSPTPCPRRARSIPTPNPRRCAAPVDALTALRECQPRELYLASLDSALHVAPSLHVELAARGHPVGRDGIDGVCESGTETLFRLRMAGRTPKLQCQVLIAGVGRVDFLIGAALVVEVDRREFHDTASAFENDRRRDAELSRRGYRVLRFSYAQVMHDWPAVEAAVLAAISRGDHHR
ncbi:endonuclease domain-containing protein [Microcella alkalica]|uniref:endonuclease domain-containing protein n=1 Tax=Microcella alkalica TaxID=355930 RepID=UPI003CCD9A0B